MAVAVVAVMAAWYHLTPPCGCLGQNCGFFALVLFFFFDAFNFALAFDSLVAATVLARSFTMRLTLATSSTSSASVLG